MDLWTDVFAFFVRTAAGYLLGVGQVVSARRLVDWGIRQTENSAELWELRGQIFLRTAGAFGPARHQDVLALLEEAAAAFGRAAKLRPDHPEYLRERGLCLLRLAWAQGARQDGPPAELLHEAIDDFTAVLEKQPRRADVLHERAMANATLRMALKDEEAVEALQCAVRDLDRSVQLRPHAPEAVLHRAEIAGELARMARRAGQRAAEIAYQRHSLQDCMRALQRRPDWEAALLRRSRAATALARLGDEPARRTDEAIGAAGRVLRHDPRNAQAVLIRADARLAAACHLAAGGDARAPMVWRQVLTDLETAMDAVGLRGQEEVVAVRAGARSEWAGALRRAGDLDGARDAWQRALDDFERAVDDDPADLDRLLGRGRALAALADLSTRPEDAEPRRQRALEDLGHALSERPGDPVVVALRADLLTGAPVEQLREALSDLEGALSRAPEHELARAARRRLLILLAASSSAGPAERAHWLAAALAECDWALRLRADDAGAHYDHARALFLAGRATAAYVALEQALSYSPGLRHTARHDPIWSPLAEAEGFLRLVGKG